MVWVGRDIEDHVVPTTCYWQGHLPLDQVARSPIQPECSWGEGILNLTGQPVPPHILLLFSSSSCSSFFFFLFHFILMTVVLLFLFYAAESERPTRHRVTGAQGIAKKMGRVVLQINVVYRIHVDQLLK